jgi:oxygen-independent coproporphyrinogen III oxidase
LPIPQALYIHIPFCAVRCHYCDFNTYAGLEKYFEPYADAVREEIRQAAGEYGRLPIKTIFIGGGTPTVLPAGRLGGILAACREHFAIAPDAEITSEANPGTVDQAHFAALRALGVNRLSMGVQSFDEAELKWLGRIHSAGEAEQAFDAARAAGFTNINLDFIFGLPGQAPGAWTRTLERAVELGPEHLSLYSLTVEAGTPLADSVRRGRVPAPDDDLAADLYLASQELLADHGYAQYEISNWAKVAARVAGQTTGSADSSSDHDPSPLYQCGHNLVYWRDEAYLGFGAGAHSYARDQRWWNVRPVPQYIQRINGGKTAVSGQETVGRRLEMGEMMMLGLRLVLEGVSEAGFRARFGVSLAETFGEELADLSARGLIERLPDRVRLTAEGRLLGNRVFAQFLHGE